MRSFSVLTIGAFLAVISSANAGVVKSYSNKIYFVTHAEPSTNGTGLSSVGMQRAECIANMFGNTSNADIGFIFTQSRDKHNVHQRPFRTVQPLAQELGLAIHEKCHRKDVKCAHKAIKHYIKHHDQNVLISWDAEYMGEIAKGFGASFTVPTQTYDLVYEIDAGQLTANSPYQENCPGLTNSTTSSSSSVAASSSSTSPSSVTVTSTSSSASSSVTPI